MGANAGGEAVGKREEVATAIGKALHFEYVNGLLTPESPVQDAARDMWEKLDRDQHRMWNEIHEGRRANYTATGRRLIDSVGAAPTDAGLRDALEKIVAEQGWYQRDGLYHICDSCGKAKHDGHRPDCVYEIARSALSQGGGE